MSKAKRLDISMLSDEKIEHIVEHAFDEPVNFDHKPTSWELELYVYKRVLEAQLALISPLIEDARKEGYKMGVFADKGFHLTDIEDAKKQERERMQSVASFTVRLDGDTVVVDKYDWDRLWQALSKEE